ncbi:MAG TPA: hypothetical protein VKI18_09600, partial [Albitalea sp.]|nr:hypothetical protein [Albitalea sp.]
YRQNLKLFLLILFLPAALAGAASFVVWILYDPRYAMSAIVLQAFGIRSILSSLAAPAENLLVASSTPQPVLVGNILRVLWLVPASLAGYHYAGFKGFLMMAMLDPLPALVYFYALQHRRGLMIVRYEALKIAYSAGVFAVSFGVTHELMALVPSLGKH